MRIWFVDAFTDRVFSGSPAAVVPLERWLPDAALHAPWDAKPMELMAAGVALGKIVA